MFTKAALSRSCLALVLASAVVAAAAWKAPSADAASPAGHDTYNFFDASLAWLSGARAPALRNGVLDTPANLVVTTDATPFVARDVTWQITKSADHDRLDVAPGATATFAYTLSVTHEIGPEIEWLVFGTIHVHNPNVFDVSGVDVTAAVDNSGTCTVEGDAVHTVTIPGNNTLDFNYFCSYSSAPSPSTGTSTATATWPEIGSPGTSASQGAPFDFTGVDPSYANGSVDVVDPQDPDGALVGSVSVDEPNPQTFGYSVDFTGDPAGTCTSHDNTASLTIDALVLGSATKTVEVCVTGTNADLTVTKTAQATFTRTFTWGIATSVDPATRNVAAGTPAPFDYAVAVTHDAGIDSNWEVTGTITVSNPNDSAPITLTGVDDVVPGGSCSITSGDPHAVVPASGSVELGYVCTFAGNPGSGVNTATATWDAAAASTSDGSANGTAGFAFGAPSTIVDGSATVTDTLGGTLGTVSAGDASPTTLTDHQTFSGDQAGTCTSHPNTATFTTSTTGTTGSNSSSATVCTGADLTVRKAVTSSSFTRTYKWKITKSVAAPTTVTTAGGSTASFNYTVTVGNDGYVDSAWAVTGTITVTNPNDWTPVVVSLADSLPGCTLDRTTVNVPRSGSVAVGYTCPLPNGSSGTNTATATWDTSVFPSPHGSATGTAAFAFGTPTTEVSKSVTVTDSFNGAPATSLGTGPGTFTYSRSVTVPATGCTTYPNTATIVETKQSASASVTACASAPPPSPLTGALTMGFWQNKNGQGIIAAADQAKLLAFLKGYAPFSDAAAPLTAYATTIIKSASGSAMNAMLKAQMLATALDVYFSDPARGGNKISAPTPIGGVRIDLTHVQPIGNTSPAFGGATSMTVSQILAYAAGQSNAGGSLWYGNVKTTQELAKDVFDAINNEWAVPV